MEDLTKRELDLLIHLRTLRPGEIAKFESPDMDADFKALHEKGFLCNVEDLSVGNQKKYRFNISAKGTDLVASLPK